MAPFSYTQKSKALFWHLPTFPVRVSSALQGLTSVFGMRTGVTLASRYQNKTLDFVFYLYVIVKVTFMDLSADEA